MESVIIKPNNTPSRDISQITSEINELRRQATCIQVAYAVEIGRRLTEAKSVLPHGRWGEWLKEEVDFSQSTANNLMKLFEEYGDSQISLFGAVSNSQTIGNLPYSKALQLLSIPAEEREAFAEEVHADQISVRELKAAIAERDRAREEFEKMKAINEELEERVNEAESAKEDAEEKAKSADELSTKIKELQRLKDDADERNAKLQEDLKEAKKNPKIPKSKLEELKAEAEAAAKAAADEELEKQLSDAKHAAQKAFADLDIARKKSEDAEKQLVEAQRQLKTANPAVTEIKVLFEELQKSALHIKSKIAKIGETDPEIAQKLGSAMKAFGASL